jgi:hypothetical protein
MDSDRHETHLNLVQVQWRREQALPHRQFPDPPYGFLQALDVLPGDLIDCIKDITELQFTVQSTKDQLAQRVLLSNMQASVESRLATCASDSPSAITQCCSLALLIISFFSFTDTWGNALIPCRLSDKLRAALQDSITSSEWSDHRSLQMWCFLVGSIVSPLNEGYVESLCQRWNELSEMVRELGVASSKSITSAFQDFFYIESLMNERLNVPAWAKLEKEISQI